MVDAAYLAESFVRGYDALWKPLDQITKDRYIKEFTQLRKIDPPYTNWLLFSSMIESFLAKGGDTYDQYSFIVGHKIDGTSTLLEMTC